MSSENELGSERIRDKYEGRMEEELKNADKFVYAKDWKFCKNKHGAKVYSRKVEWSKFLMFKAVDVVKDISVLDYFEFYFAPTRAGDIDRIKLVNPNTKTVNVIHTFEKDRLLVMFLSFKSGSYFVADREFLLMRRIEKSEDRVLIITKSMDDEEDKLWKGGKKDVRAKMLFILSITKKGDDVVVENIGWTDPKGSVPVALFNIFSQDRCLNILEYKKLLNKENKDRQKT